MNAFNKLRSSFCSQRWSRGFSALALLLGLRWAAHDLHAQTTVYWDLNGSTSGASAGSTASGTWDQSTTSAWTTSSGGTAATDDWATVVTDNTNGGLARFSAGTNATGSSTITVSGTVGNNSNGYIYGIRVDEGTLTFGGTGTLYIRTGGINNTTSNLQTFNANLNLVSNQTWTTGTGGIYVGGNVSIGTSNRTLTVTGGEATIAGNISQSSGSRRLTKAGTGTLTLSGNNTFSNGTTLSAGTLNINSATALGTGTFTIGANTTINNTSGSTVTNTNNNAQTWSGNFTFTGTNDLNLGTGAINMGGANRTVTVNGGNLILGGVINESSGSRRITKAGAGTLTLSGSNTFAGGITINAGTVEVNSLANGGVASSIGNSTNAANRLIINGGTLRYTGGATSTDRRFTIGTSGATIDSSGSGALSFTSTASDAVAFTGTGTRTLTLAGSNTGNNAIAGVIANQSSNATSLVKTGTGKWALSGTNTYSGTTTVSAGTLLAQNSSALGANTGNVTVTSGATLALDGGLTLDKTGATTNLAGTGAGGAGALAAVGTTGSTTQYNGNLSLTGNTTITAADNLLILGDNNTFANTITTNGHTLTLNTTSASGVTPTYGPYPAYILDDSNIYITGTITGTGGLTKTGAGTVNLVSFPGVGQAYTGDTLITGGKLIVDGEGQIDGFNDPTINSTNVIVGNVSSPGSADSVILQMGQLASPPAENYLIGYYDISTNTATTNLTIYEDGLFNLNGGSNRLNTLTLRGGHVTGRDLTTYNPLLTIVNGVTTTASAQTAVIEELNLGMSANGFTFTIANGSADEDLRIDGILQNGIGFTAANSADSMVKTGLGTMVLTNANSYQGVTSIDQGVLRIRNNGALGQYGTFGSLDNGTTVASGAQLQLDGSSGNLTIGTETLTLNGTGVSNTGALLNTAGSNTYKGFVFLESDARINAASGTTLEIGNYSGVGNTLNVNGGIMNGTAAGKNLTVGGSGDTIINGAIGNYVQNITKDGTGTLTLAGNNSYTGATSVTAGAVKVTHNSGLAGTGATVSNGAALQFAQDANNNNINVVAVSSNIQGTGISNGGAIQNLNGSNTYQGAITLANDARITANSGSSLTLTGNVALNTHTLDAGGLGTTTYTGVISNGAFTKTDTGTVTLGGTSANTFTGGLNVNGGTLNLNKTAGVNAVGAGSTVTIGDNIGSASSANLVYQASNQMPDSTDLVINSDGRLVMGTYTDSISSIAGTGLIDLGTTGVLTIGADDSNSVYDGTITGSGTLVKDGDGSLTFTQDISYTGTLEVGGGTLVLSGMDLTVTNLIITADTILDFSGLDSRIFATNFSFLSEDITLNIINWTKNADGFFATNWLGATPDLVNNGGAKPMSQILFDGLNPEGDPWTWNDTGWDSANDEIYPRVPEPSTYGALLTAASLALLAHRKRKARQSTASNDKA